MGVREIDRCLEQWQMGVKDLRRRMILAPTPRGAGSGGTPSCCWPRAGRQRPRAEALERDPHTIGRWASAFGEGGPVALIFEQTGGSPPDRGMYGVLWRDKAGYLQGGLGFRPGFGQQPDPAPEPSPVQRAPEPGDAMPDYADGPSRLLRAAAMSGRQRPGRRAQAAGGNPPVIGVFHSGPVGQGQQCCHRQHQPMAGYSLRIGPASLLPLPAQALERLEPQLDPEAQRIPTHSNLLRGKVGQDDPGLLLFCVPDRQQGATAFGGATSEGGAPADPGGIGTGNGRRGPATFGRPRRRR